MLPFAEWPPSVGERIQSFEARTFARPRYIFDSVAGRYVVLCFLGSAGGAQTGAVLKALLSGAAAFDDENVAFFGVTIDPGDQAAGRIADRLPGVRFILDFDRKVSRLFGALAGDDAGPSVHYRPFTLILDPTLRVMSRIPFGPPAAHGAAVFGFLRGLPPAGGHAGVPLHAPVLVVPRVFEPELCRHLMDLYARHGGEDSGFMRENEEGKTVAVLDHAFKRRFDWYVGDAELRAAIGRRIARRLNPAVEQAFQFRPTRMERYLVACYDAEPGGFFRPHRDNRTRGTAHRRFAVTINLNAEDYEGGDLRFPEFGARTYRAPTGGAVVFSCSLLHEALPVTRGRRFAFLPFLYDDAAARLREQNNPYLGEGLQPYAADAVEPGPGSS